MAQKLSEKVGGWEKEMIAVVTHYNEQRDYRMASQAQNLLAQMGNFAKFAAEQEKQYEEAQAAEQG